MFAYCGNNPVNRSDSGGNFWEIIVAGAIAAAVSGVANAISTAINGGSVEECLVAGLIGAGSAAVGFTVAFATGFTSVGNLAGRAVASTLCDLGTTYYLNGEITNEDILYTATDVTIDVACSMYVYANTDSINNFTQQTFVNSVYDGAVDVAETYFQNYGSLEQPLNAQSGISQGNPGAILTIRGGNYRFYAVCAM